MEQTDQKTDPKSQTEVKNQKVKVDRKNWLLLELPKIFPISIIGGFTLILMLMILSVVGFSIFLASVHDDLDDAKDNVQFINALLTNRSHTKTVITQK